MPMPTDASFLDNMHKLFGFDADRTEKLVAHLEPDALIDLAAAAADGDKIAAMRAAVSGALAEDRELIKSRSTGRALSDRPSFKNKDPLLGGSRDKEEDMNKILRDEINEGILGMTVMPDLTRLRALAGMPGPDDSDSPDVADGAVEMKMLPAPQSGSDLDEEDDSTARVLGALNCVEQNLPGVTVADLKNIRSRLNGILMKLSESTGGFPAPRRLKA